MDVKRNDKPKRWAINELLKGEFVRHAAMPPGDHLWMNKAGTIFKITASGKRNKVNINGENYKGDRWGIFRAQPKFKNGDRAIDILGREVKIVEVMEFNVGSSDYIYMVRDTADGRNTFLAAETMLGRKEEKAI